MPVLKNIISTKQRIRRFITGSPEMIRRTEEIYRAVLGFYLDVIHDNLDKLPGWDRNSGTRALERLTVRTEPRMNRKTGKPFGGNPNPPYPIDAVWPKFPAYLRRAIISKAIGMAKSWYTNYQRWLKKKASMEERNQRRKLHLDDSWEMTVPTIYEKEGIFHLVIAFEKKSNVMKFADYYWSKNPKVLAVDLNLGRKNRAVCALVGKDGTVHKVRHIGLTACNTTDVHRLLGLIARNVS
ncbi:MAG: transposase, partial [Alicyclobacillaceae bacterium]|nr:transposase [Alicyclobacillaceae bacterium]